MATRRSAPAGGAGGRARRTRRRARASTRARRRTGRGRGGAARRAADGRPRPRAPTSDASCAAFASALLSFEELHGLLVLLGGSARLEGAEVPPLARLRVL